MTAPGEHTQGPWIADGANNVKTEDGEQLAMVSGWQTGGAGPKVWAQQEANDLRDAANARLMAAAPELLEALYNALNLESVARWGAEVVHAKNHENLDVPYHFAEIRKAIATAVAPGYSAMPVG
jgi:hypothetical protein